MGQAFQTLRTLFKILDSKDMLMLHSGGVGMKNEFPTRKINVNAPSSRNNNLESGQKFCNPSYINLRHITQKHGGRKVNVRLIY